MMALSAKGFELINEVKEFWLISDFILSTVTKNVLNMANSAYHDAASHLSLRYL